MSEWESERMREKKNNRIVDENNNNYYINDNIHPFSRVYI